MRKPVKRLITVAFLLLLFVSGLAFASGDGDIPEVRPIPVTLPSGEPVADCETDQAGMPPLDLLTLVLSALLAII